MTVTVVAVWVTVGLVGLWVASHRSSQLPVAADPDAEMRLAAALLTDPTLRGWYTGRYPARWFVTPDVRHALEGSSTVVTLTAEPSPADVAALQDARHSPDPDVTLRTHCPAHRRVADAYDGRELLTGTVDTVVRDSDGLPVWPLQRRRVMPNVPTATAVVTAAVALAVTTVTMVGAMVPAGPARWATLTVFTVLFAGATVLALLDWWTMWVDVPTLKLWTLTVAAVTVVAVTVADAPLWSPAAAVATLLVVGLFEVGGWWLSGRHGRQAHGLGDTLVVPTLLYLPLAVAASQVPAGAPTMWTVTVVAGTTATILVVVAVAAGLSGVLARGPDPFGRVAFLPAWTVGPGFGWALTGVWL